MQNEIGRDGLPVVDPKDGGTAKDNRTQEQIADNDMNLMLEGMRQKLAAGEHSRH